MQGNDIADRCPSVNCEAMLDLHVIRLSGHILDEFSIFFEGSTATLALAHKDGRHMHVNATAFRIPYTSRQPGTPSPARPQSQYLYIPIAC